MHNRFETLLTRCKKRKRKLVFKRIALLITALLVIGGGVVYMEISSVTPVSMDGVSARPVSRPVPEQPISKPKTDMKRAKKGEETAKKEGTFVKQELILLNKAERTMSAGAERSSKRPEKLKQTQQKERLKTVAPKQMKSANEETILFSEKRKDAAEPHIKPVIEVKDVTDLDALVRQFDKYPRYATALKIAQIHYEKGDFENASLWARKANLLDRDDEEAWILYAKSEYALGRKERASRILRLYLDYKDSPKARTLLLTWSKE